MGQRAGWLGRWWFLAAVTVLAANDHLLKDRYPGWWTGKASDVAGVLVVAVLAAVVLGRRTGVVVTALAFTALKVVPGTAEAVAPVLGGVTRRDPSDLLALVMLGPTWWLLGRADPSPAASPSGPVASAGPVAHRRPARARSVAASVLPVFGACAAVVVATATSCVGDPAVVQVVAVGDRVYAELDRAIGRAATWAVSEDGGRSWRQSPSPDVPSLADPGEGSSTTLATTTVDEGATTRFPELQDTTTSTTSPADGRREGLEPPTEPVEACGPVACYRLTDQRLVERRLLASDRWTVEHRLSADGLDDISTGCANPQVGVLTTVAVVPTTGGGEAAVAGYGARGALVRSGDGSWRVVQVLGTAGPDLPLRERVPWFAYPFGPILGGAIWVSGRHGRPEARWTGASVALGGWLGLVFVGFRSTGPTEAFSPRSTVIAMVAITVVAVALARALGLRGPMHRPPPGAPLPPPPLPPPPAAS